MSDATAELERAAADIPINRDAREILEHATQFASRRGAAQASPTDVLEAIVADRGSAANQAMRTLGADPEAVKGQIDNADDSSVPLRQLLVNANREAQVLGHYQVDSIHLLLALLYSDARSTSSALQKAGLTLYDVRRHLQTGAGPNIPVEAGVQSRRDKKLRRKPLVSLRGALGISPIFAGLVAITAVAGVVLWYDLLPGLTSFVVIVFVTGGWITSVCVHEFGHAVTAYLGGDRSVRASGYLTLDPRKYTNLLMSIIFPIVFLLLGGIGLPGGAVYIDHSAIRSRLWDSLVSLAGPIVFVIFALVIAIPFLWPGYASWLTNANLPFFAALAYLGFIEVVAVLLNLLPIPGLDGFGVLRPWLPYSIQVLSVRYSQFTIIGLFILLFYVTPARSAFFSTAVGLSNDLGVPTLFIAVGQHLMRFI
jgi:Zn-dependent protease